ncbi:hypothetical protein HBE96_23460 [Clostridium sp. P21]|uniref:Uncharacterized protein n=1 Tax=Clostridium muellerianum TaxID=2716538 RepID=A0A7Y0EL77_9CLOT|nr:hypothetical protein [Clostridium muellerianum]NMM65539.1 hypothetical protein [Clostridium muellerianum]
MKRYIYNLQQAYFYIQNGVLPLDPPAINHNTNKVYFTFNNEKTKEVYKLWCDRKH